MNTVEEICADGELLAYLVRAQNRPDKTTFITPNEAKMQVGYIVYPAGGEVLRHVHVPVERRLVGTTEVIIIQYGRCEVDVYTDAREHVTTRELNQGDMLITVSGGHGFRMHEDTVILEIKQGPYYPADDKIRF